MTNEFEALLKKIVPKELCFTANNKQVRIYNFPFSNIRKIGGCGGRSCLLLNHQEEGEEYEQNVKILTKAITMVAFQAIPDEWGKIKAGKTYSVKDIYETIVSFNIFRKEKGSWDAFVEVIMIKDFEKE